jgi:phosphatidylcholine synthase
MAEYGPMRRLAAWAVHLYTAMGLPLAYLCAVALADHDARSFFLWQTLACWVDASDGFFARRVDVKKVLPGFSGRRLDDIVDYIHFVALPMAAIVAFDLLPPVWQPLVVLPLLASGYGFCQEMAKTDDAFVGFPSYWNILVLYLYVLHAPARVVGGSLIVLSALVFLPIYYAYPSKTKLAQAWTIGLGMIWLGMVVFISLRPEAAIARKVAWASLFYPAWYLGVSLIHDRAIRRKIAAGEVIAAG